MISGEFLFEFHTFFLVFCISFVILVSTMDEERKKFIGRKRKGFKGQITRLNNSLAGSISRVSAEARLKSLTVLFDEYVSLQMELEDLAPDDEAVGQFDALQDDYYAVLTKVHEMPVPGGSSSTSSSRPSGTVLASSTMIERQQLVKLPTAPLPTFNGDHNKWLEFKQNFDSMIDTRTDLDGVNKFNYLRSALTGPAADKLRNYTPSAESYKNVREELVKCYEKKRVLITKHINAIHDIAPLKTVTPEGLVKLVDTARQHLHMLETLEVKSPDVEGVVNFAYALITCWLERALPTSVRLEWEKASSLDKMPTFQELCDFITKHAYHLTIVGSGGSGRQGDPSGKRQGDNGQRSNKFRKDSGGARSLVTSTQPATATNSSNSSCVQCQQAHPLFQCPVFGKMSIAQRWTFVRAKKVCHNCLRSHVGQCSLRHCKHCPKFHNSLLHNFDQNSKTEIKTDRTSST